MNLRLLATAQLELDEAIAWYNAQVPGLGDAFFVEALRVFRLIEEYPWGWQPLSPNTRRCRLSRFPYGVVYTREGDGDELLVIAIAHLHRQPKYWRDRLRDAGP